MEMEQTLRKLPPAPPGIARWIRRTLAKGAYIIYSKKEDKAVCTRCGHIFRASRFEMKHGAGGACPKCKTKGMCLASGRGRKKYVEYMRVLVFTHRGKTVYGTLTEIGLDYSPFGQPAIKIWLADVFVFSGNEQHHYKHKPEWCFAPGRWEEAKAMKLPAPPSPMGYYAIPKFERTEVYTANLERVFKNSCLKYLYDQELFGAYDFDAYDYIRYMHLALRYRSIELLSKAGFKELAYRKVIGQHGSGCVNWRGKELKKILRLPMRDIRRVRQHNPDFRELKTYQQLTDREKMLPWKTIQRISKAQNWHRVQLIQKHVDVTKWAVWAAANNVQEHDWADYIRDCERAGLDLRRKKVLLPDNFHETHRRLSAEIEEKENAEKDGRMRRIAEAYAMKVSHETLALEIAKSQQELNRESAALGHCVKSYGGRVAAGETLIFFIRKKALPDEPFYTLEIRPDGTFVQCRGENNCGMTEGVEAFKDMAVSEFNRMLKKWKKEGRSIAWAV